MNPRISLLATLTFLLIISNVLAVPGLPHAFYGSVTLNGQPAPDGTIITAKIDGKEVATTATSGGKYGYPVGSFYVDDPNNDRTGSTVHFFVNGIDTGKTVIFCNGCATRLDLSVGSTTTTVRTSGGGGGVSGTTGGNHEGSVSNETTTTIAQTESKQQCQERWVCTPWSECKNGIQTRTCKDENNCGTDFHKPLESQPCVAEEKTATTGNLAPITGFFALIPSQTLIGLVTIILIVLIFFGWRKVFPR